MTASFSFYMKKYIKLLLLLIYATSAQGQSLDSLIEMAIQTHPSLRVADLKIKQQELLKKSGFELAPTDFYYLGQALGYANDNRQHDFGVSQSFQLPKVYDAKNALIDAEAELLKQEKKFTIIEVEKMTIQLYWQIRAIYHEQQVCMALDSVYQEFIKFATLGLETGEANKLELLRIEASFKSWELKKNKIDKRYEFAQWQLAYLLGQDDWMNIEHGFLPQLSLDEIEVDVTNHSLMNYYKQQKNVAESQVTIEENELSPTFNIGYASQIFNDNAGLNLVQVGVSVPLHKKPQRQRIEAAKVNVSIIQAKAETEKFQLEKEWKLALKKLNRISGQLYYIRRLEDTLKESMDLARIAYESGELPYFEYLNIIEAFFNAKIEYLNLSREYNETVILINYEFGM